MTNPTEKALFACAWKVEEFSKLLEKNVSLSQSMKNIISILESGNTKSVATTLTNLRQELLDYVKGIVRMYLVNIRALILAACILIQFMYVIVFLSLFLLSLFQLII